MLRNGRRWPNETIEYVAVHRTEYRSSPASCTRETRTQYALRTARRRRAPSATAVGTNNEITVIAYGRLWYDSTRSGRTRNGLHRWRSKTAIRVRRPSGRRSRLQSLSDFKCTTGLRRSARPFSQCSRLVPSTPPASARQPPSRTLSRADFICRTPGIPGLRPRADTDSSPITCFYIIPRQRHDAPVSKVRRLR